MNINEKEETLMVCILPNVYQMYTFGSMQKKKLFSVLLVTEIIPPICVAMLPKNLMKGFESAG